MSLLLIATVLLLALYGWLSGRRPGAWSNGFVLAMGLAAAAATIMLGLLDVPVVGPVVVVLFLVLLVLGTISLPFALIVNGVVMWRREGPSVGNVLSGVLGAGIIALVVWLVLSLSEGLDLLVLIGVSAILALGWLSFGFLGYLASVVAVHRARPLPGNHRIIVLGSGLVNGKVPRLLAGRLDRAVDQWRTDHDAGYRSVLIPSGGKGDDEPRAEGTAMAEYLLDHGVPAEAILVEDRARNTEENLRYSRELMPATTENLPAERVRQLPEAARSNPPVVIVTSSYHGVRAAQLARAQHLPARVLGAPTAWYYLPSAMLREYVALLVAKPWFNGMVLALLLASGPVLWALSR